MKNNIDKELIRIVSTCIIKAQEATQEIYLGAIRGESIEHHAKILSKIQDETIREIKALYAQTNRS